MCNDSPKVGISIMLSSGPPTTTSKPGKRPNVEDQVRACIQRIDDGTGTEVDLLLLKRLKAALMEKKSPKKNHILKMIEPTLRRFGYYF